VSDESLHKMLAFYSKSPDGQWDFEAVAAITELQQLRAGAEERDADADYDMASRQLACAFNYHVAAYDGKLPGSSDYIEGCAQRWREALTAYRAAKQAGAESNQAGAEKHMDARTEPVSEKKSGVNPATSADTFLSPNASAPAPSPPAASPGWISAEERAWALARRHCGGGLMEPGLRVDAAHEIHAAESAAEQRVRAECEAEKQRVMDAARSAQIHAVAGVTDRWSDAQQRLVGHVEAANKRAAAAEAEVERLKGGMTRSGKTREAAALWFASLVHATAHGQCTPERLVDALDAYLAARGGA
jgi:hypothetical protein